MYEILITIFLSLLPVSELRGGMIYALMNGINVYLAFILTLSANILAVFLAFLFFDFVHKELMKIRIYQRTFDSYMERVRKKADKVELQIGNYGFLALFIFVAVPLPGTGCWTAALIAWYLGLNRRKSIFAIVLGVIGAGILVLLASLGVIRLF